MVLNNRGQVIFFGFMLGIVVIILALAFAPVIKERVDNARNVTTGLDCSNSSISDFDKAACISTDMTTFYVVGGLIFIGGAIIFAKYS